MKSKITLILSCAALCFSSCTRVLYPALYHQDIAYMPAPSSVDTAKSLTYISGGLNTGTNGSFNDTQTSGQLNLSRGYSFKDFSLAYGFFGVAGNYENDNGNNEQGNPARFEDKFYGVLGGRIAGSYVIVTDKADFRPIGLEASYSHEFGSYANFRDNLYNNTQITQNAGGTVYVDPRVNLFTLGLTSEVVFHKYRSSGFQHGINFFLGGTFGHNVLDGTYYNGNDDNFNANLFRNLYFKAGYFMKYKNFFAIAEVSPLQLGARVGFAF